MKLRCFRNGINLAAKMSLAILLNKGDIDKISGAIVIKLVAKTCTLAFDLNFLGHPLHKIIRSSKLA